MHWSALTPSHITLNYVSCRTTIEVANAEIERERKLLEAQLDAEAQKDAAAAAREQKLLDAEARKAAAAAARAKAKLVFQIKQRKEQLKQEKELIQMQMDMSVVHHPLCALRYRRDQRADLMPMACCVGRKNRRSTTSGWRT
eukprot:COSAG02_NODE_3239_length_7114_cov_295.628938_5_plen_142_part_00